MNTDCQDIKFKSLTEKSIKIFVEIKASKNVALNNLKK